MKLMLQRLIPFLNVIVVTSMSILFFLSAIEKARATNFCVSNPTELQNALSTASNNNQTDEIQIVQGLYKGNFVYASANELHHLLIYGGYTNGCSSRDIDPKNTVLDGNNTGTVLVLSSDGSESDLVISGLTLRNGNTTNNHGGGLYAVSDEFIFLSYCIIEDSSVNCVYCTGGGAYLRSKNGPVIISNNTIANNYSKWVGGVNVICTYGTINIFSNVINGNRTDIYAGGLYVNNASYANISFNIISNNDCSGWGGGLIVFSIDEVVVRNNVIYNNYAEGYSSVGGGGIASHSPTSSHESTTTITNNSIINNSSDNPGGGLYFDHLGEKETLNIYNNIIWNNTSPKGSDIYINNDQDGNFLTSVTNVYSNNFDQSAAGTSIQIPFPIDASNLDNLDPIFVDPNNNDYHLSATSPCRDTGDNGAPRLPATDMDGQPRIMNDVVDMGAYEFKRIKSLSWLMLLFGE